MRKSSPRHGSALMYNFSVWSLRFIGPSPVFRTVRRTARHPDIRSHSNDRRKRSEAVKVGRTCVRRRSALTVDDAVVLSRDIFPQNYPCLVSLEMRCMLDLTYHFDVPVNQNPCQMPTSPRIALGELHLFLPIKSQFLPGEHQHCVDARGKVQISSLLCRGFCKAHLWRQSVVVCTDHG